MFKANENVYSFITCTLWLTLAKLSARTCSAFTSFEIATDGAVTCLPMVSVAKTLPSSPENECCATFPKERIIAITAAALNRGINLPVSVRRFAFTTGDEGRVLATDTIGKKVTAPSVAISNDVKADQALVDSLARIDHKAHVMNE